MAQSNNDRDHKGWFTAVSGELPSIVCTFSSFGSGHNGPGWGAGVSVGRTFGAVLSAELSVTAGQAGLSARECCTERGYWLGADRTRYNAPVVDMAGWDYSDIKSDVTFTRMDARLNVNVLGFFLGTKDCPWKVEVSPTLSALGFKTDIKAAGKTVFSDCTEWDFGAGGRLLVGHSLTKRTYVALFSQLLTFTGKKVDAMPDHQHNSNSLWTNGVRIGWTFGGGKGK